MQPKIDVSLSSETEEYKHGMLAGVAFEIEVSCLEGKYKLSQNRPESDRQRVIQSLGQGGDPAVVGLAQATAERRT